jgi:hypothetical protein
MSNVINFNKTVKDGVIEGRKRPVNDLSRAPSTRRLRALATELYANGFSIASLETSDEQREILRGSILECLDEPDRSTFKAFLLNPISQLVGREDIAGRLPFEGGVFGRQEVLQRRRGVAKYMDQYEVQVIRYLRSIEIIQQACLGSDLRARLQEQRCERVIPRPPAVDVSAPEGEQATHGAEQTLAQTLAAVLGTIAPLRREIIERTYEINRERTLTGRQRHTTAHIAEQMSLEHKVVGGHYQVAMKLLRHSSRNEPLLAFVHTINPGFVNTPEETLLCDIFNLD